MFITKDVFAARLKQLRKMKKIDQTALSKAIEISRTSIAMYEQARRSPDICVLVRLGDFFNVSVDYLLGRTDKLPLEHSDKLDITAEEMESLKRSAKSMYKILNRNDIRL